MKQWLKIFTLVTISATFITSCSEKEALTPSQTETSSSLENARVEAAAVTPSFVLATTNFYIKAGEKKELLKNGRYTLVHESNGTLSIYLNTTAKVRSIPIYYAEYFTSMVPANATPFEYYWQFYGDGLVRTVGYWFNGTKKGAYIYSGAVVYNSRYGYYKLNLTSAGKLQFLFQNGALGREI